MNNIIKKAKTPLLISSLIAFIALTGCSKSKNDSNEHENISKSSKVMDASKIEVVKNVDAHAIKIKSKDKKSASNDSFYYSYGKKKKQEEGLRQRTTMDAQMNIRNSYQKIRMSMIVGKLSKDFILKCSACHDDYANGVIGPSLLDKNASFIYNKINAFKTGKAKNVLMYELVQQMSDKEIKNISNEIYTFNKKIKKMRDEK